MPSNLGHPADHEKFELVVDVAERSEEIDVPKNFAKIAVTTTDGKALLPPIGFDLKIVPGS